MEYPKGICLLDRSFQLWKNPLVHPQPRHRQEALNGVVTRLGVRSIADVRSAAVAASAAAAAAAVVAAPDAAPGSGWG